MMKNKNGMQFYVLLRDFLSEHLVVRRNFSPKTVRTYKQSLNMYREYCQDEKGIPFTDLGFECFTRKNIYDFLVWLKQERGCAPSTQNLRLSAIKSFLKFCGEEDIALMPLFLEVSGIHKFKEQKKERFEYLTTQQIKLLFMMPDIGTRNGRRDRFFLIFTYETGARMDELLNMKIQDIVRSDGNTTVRILGKGSKIRHIPLDDSTVKHLDTYLREFHESSQSDDYLFFTVHDGRHTQMKPGTVDYMMKKHGNAAHEAEATFPKGLHCHVLRHSIAMAMLKNGIPISYIRDFLGHSSIETTSIYSHADDEMIAEALASVEHETTPSIPSDKKWKGKEEYLLSFCGFK